MTMTLDKFSTKALRDYDALVEHVRIARKLPQEIAEELARTLLIAARLDMLDSTLATGLPTAGEGI
jgi:hypothetical protein